MGRRGFRPVSRVHDGLLEVLERRHQQRGLPQSLRGLPLARLSPLPYRRGMARRGDHRVYSLSFSAELHGAESGGLGGRGAGGGGAGAVLGDGGGGGAEDPTGEMADATGDEDEEERLEPLLQHALLEPQLLGQRQHHGRGGEEPAEDVPLGAAGRGGDDVSGLSGAVVRRHGLPRRFAGRLGPRLPRQRRRSVFHPSLHAHDLELAF